MEERFGVQDLSPSMLYMRDGKEVEIKMTFGLLNVLLQALGNYNNVPLVGIDPTINDIVLRKILTLRDHKGKPVEGHDLENIYEIEVSVDDIEKLLFFCQQHMADFTLRALNRAASLNKQTKAAQESLSSLTTGLIGSLDSPSLKSAA